MAFRQPDMGGLAVRRNLSWRAFFEMRRSFSALAGKP